jgi:D-alanine-D-alanine ligase
MTKIVKEKTKKKIIENKSYCIGPVDNLEKHVRPDWWKNVFNHLYLKTDGDVVEDKNITKNEIDELIKITDIHKEETILDLCCGQGRHVIELQKRGFKYAEGIDRSHYLINKARKRIKDEGLNIKFKEGDARKLPYANDSFDLVILMGNSFGYFETALDDIKVLKEIRRILKPNGRIFLDIANGDYLKQNYEPRSWEWMENNYFVCRERSLSQDKQRLIAREIIMHTDKGIVSDQFYAVRLYDQTGISNLLVETLFENIIIHQDVESSSIRNQDLGMMKNRFLISGVVHKEWSKKNIRKQKELKEIAVIFGDPSKSDPLKPHSIFDEDDMLTINELKKALSKLPHYKFHFLQNHDQLINELLKIKNKINYIFNLCDEGFNNDPKKELHIPSLLELLNIPYTGSNPQTLAYCYDKSLIRGLAKEMNIPVPDAFLIKPEDTVFEFPIFFPAIAKPNIGDSSFGINKNSVVNNIEELTNAIFELRDKLGYDKPILVEEFLPGADLSIGIIGNPPESYKILPIIEEDYSRLDPSLPQICGYEAKWFPESPYGVLFSKQANISEKAKNSIISNTLKLCERLEIKDYCRLDWRLDSNNNPKLLEVNPNPGWCWDGHLAKMANFDNISYDEMIKMILTATENRIGLS